jgi:regulator of protease activity HflC (stomatin/prohibitin superfamily)
MSGTGVHKHPNREGRDNNRQNDAHWTSLCFRFVKLDRPHISVQAAPFASRWPGEGQTDPRAGLAASPIVEAEDLGTKTLNRNNMFRHRETMPEICPMSLAVLLAALFVFAVLFALMAVRPVPQGYQWTVERFGRYTRTLRPGLNIILPLIDRIGSKMNMMETVLDVPTQEVITKDNAMVSVDGVVFFQVMDAAKAAYEVNDLQNAILNLTMTNIRTVLGSMDLDEMLSKRDEINAKLLQVVDQATSPWGVKATRIEIKDIDPPRDLVDAMARQMKAEREKRAAILEADGQREAAIKRAEGNKQAMILEAEARKQAAILDAEARERAAEAEAKATAVVSEAISKGDVQAVNYFLGVKYVDALGRLAESQNQKTILMPLDASGVIGAIAGISEIAKAALPNNR